MKTGTHADCLSPVTSFDIFCNAPGGWDVFRVRSLSSLVFPVAEQTKDKCRILVVENSDESRTALRLRLSGLGYAVQAAGAVDDATARQDLDQFDLILSDLEDRSSPADAEVVRAFKLSVTSARARAETSAVRGIVEAALRFKLRYIDSARAAFHEKIDFELPSDLSLMNVVLEYLLDRVDKMGLIKAEQSNLFVALDEAFVNAVKHGSRNDPTKLVRITAELSPHEAIFTVEDEGEGFDVREIPDPRDPANLFKSTGRGVLLIYNIMDEVEYSEHGTRLRMVKRPESSTSEPPAVAGG
jgi:serine/threonine-protein kinase RsbW